MLRHVLDAARELTGAGYAALGILDRDKRELERFVFVGIDEQTRARIGPLPRGHGLLGELIREPRVLRLSSLSDHPHSYGFPAEHPPMTTFLGGPVRIRDAVYGNLYLTEKEGGQEFTEADEELLVVLAEWAAIAIENARAHEAGGHRQRELERAVRGLEATTSLNREVERETELDRVLELVVKRGRALVEATACLVSLGEGQALRIAAAAGEVPEGLLGRKLPSSAALDEVARTGAVQRIARVQLASVLPQGLSGTRALLAPLRSRGSTLGVLIAIDRAGEDPDFARDDELALGSFSNTAAGAIAATRAFADERARLATDASERERRRWARELHDETLQELGALQIAQQSALDADDAETMKRSLRPAVGAVEEIIENLEGLITELRPAALDQLGSQAAVEALIDRMNARNELQISADFDLAFESGREATRHEPELEVTIYRLIQEALTNVVKHANATHARVAVEERNERVTITVEDDGDGFGGNGGRQGFGLLGMRERVQLVNGDLELGPAATGGARVRAILPAARRPDPA